MKNSKPTTLQFESDFDFETANAQFKDDLKKDVVGKVISNDTSQITFSAHVKCFNVCYLHFV